MAKLNSRPSGSSTWKNLSETCKGTDIRSPRAYRHTRTCTRAWTTDGENRGDLSPQGAFLGAGASTPCCTSEACRASTSSTKNTQRPHPRHSPFSLQAGDRNRLTCKTLLSWEHCAGHNKVHLHAAIPFGHARADTHTHAQTHRPHRRMCREGGKAGAGTSICLDQPEFAVEVTRLVHV